MSTTDAETLRARAPARLPNGRFPPGNGVGAGCGYGGPAKGEWGKVTAETQPSPAAKSAGIAAARTAAEAARPHAVNMVEVWRSIAEDRDAPHMARIAAAEKLVDRAEGKPTQPLANDSDRPLFTVHIDG